MRVMSFLMKSVLLSKRMLSSVFPVSLWKGLSESCGRTHSPTHSLHSTTHHTPHTTHHTPTPIPAPIPIPIPIPPLHSRPKGQMTDRRQIISSECHRHHELQMMSFSLRFR